jgi:multidrug efflux system outer membrane protein
MKIFWFFSCCVLLFSGCRVGPRYTAPSSPVPSAWKTVQQEPTLGLNVEHWWEVFHDECLNNLETKVIACNYTFYVALEKVEEARASAGVNKADLYPQIALNGGYKYIQDQVKSNLSKKAKTLGFLESIQIQDQHLEFPNIFSYELDLWQKYRGQYKAAIFNTQAQEQHAKGILLTLTTELASAYFNLRALDSQVQLTQEILSLLKETLQFHRSRYTTGLDTYLDVATAEKSLSLVEAAYQELLLQRLLFENAIAVLIGAPASEFHLPSNPLLVTNIPSIPAGIPSSVLTRRPDIAEAERVMAAKHALINVAYASFFPDFSITGGGGLASIQLKHFLNLKNYFFEFGANLIQSIIDAGRNRSNLNAAKARFQQAEGSYQQLVLKAFQEVEDSLSAIEYQEHQSEDIFSAFNSSQKLSSLSERRYNVGIVNELEVLNNKKSLLETEQLWIQITSLRYQSTLSLIKALGGSWSN